MFSDQSALKKKSYNRPLPKFKKKYFIFVFIHTTIPLLSKSNYKNFKDKNKIDRIKLRSFMFNSAAFIVIFQIDHLLSSGNIFFIKNVSSSISHKQKNSVFPKFRDLKKILTSTFIYEPILIQIYMNANIMKTQIFHFIKYDLKGH